MIKFNVDGEHKDRKLTRTKIVVDKSGIGLKELINIRGNLYYFIILPEEISGFISNKLPLKDTNHNYIAIGQSSFGLSDRRWQIDPINNTYVYRWFAMHNKMRIVRDNLRTLEDLESDISLFIREHKLLIFS